MGMSVMPYKFKNTIWPGILMNTLHNGSMNEEIDVDSE